MRNYNKGDIIEIYKDYQTNERLLGKAELIKFDSQGLSFILEDYTNCPVYNTEKWLVNWIEKTDPTYPYLREYYNIRYNISEKEELYKEDEEKEDVTLKNSLEDSFIQIEGKQIY